MGPRFIDARFVESIAAKIGEVLKASPAADIEKNLKATLATLFARMDLVTREEFDVQAEVLARAREMLTQLEARLARLEGTPAPSTSDGATSDDARPGEGAPV
jgi:BMFP domain-containing protein YqiC